MAHTVRHRFVALDLADGWIDLGHGRMWTLRHADREGDLILSTFPVAAGVSMDLALLQHLEHERRRRSNEMDATHLEHDPWFTRTRLLDEVTWSRDSVFCVATKSQWEMPNAAKSPLALAKSPLVVHRAGWTISDGRYVLEATFRTESADAFGVSVVDCEAMMRSVRFEGPS